MPTTRMTIGGNEIEVPELNLKALKKIFPIVQRMKLHTEAELEADPSLVLESMDTAVEIIAIALARSASPLTPEQIEDQMTTSELNNLQFSLVELLANNGLQAKPGESQPATVGAGSRRHSTETSTQSSAKSSQASEQPTGT